MAGSQAFFEGVLQQATDKTHAVVSFEHLSGGCIDQVVKLETKKGRFLLKWKDRTSDQFEAESIGLTLLHKAHCLRVPEVIAQSIYQGCSYLLMEYVAPGSKKTGFWEEFGTKLAQQHRHLADNSHYGLDHDNYIGSLHQYNAPNADWIAFFIEQRLEKQLALASENGWASKDLIDRFQILYPQLPELLSMEPPSLLHGDLWSGNFIVDDAGSAVLIDPAVYYGNREIEIAFTQMFGGFEPPFYQSYQESWPLAPGFQERAAIYNLYPLLVHVNLFGSSYLSGIDRVLRRYT